MLDRKSQKIWIDFKILISSIVDDETLLSIFKKISEWYRRNKKYLSERLITLYKIDDLVNIFPEEYPLQWSEASVFSIKNLLLIEPSSEESMIMLLRDKLWEIVVFNVDRQCPRCKQELGLSALLDSKEKKIILECPQCGWTQTNDGQYYEPINMLSIPKTTDLISSGLLSSLSDGVMMIARDEIG
jgi:hypothetical protein